MAYNIVTDEALKEIMLKTKQGLNDKVSKESGKTLTANDLTDALKKSYDEAVSDVTALKAVGSEKNIINTVKVNGTALTPDSARAVDVTVPTDSDIKKTVEGYGYQTASDVNTAITDKGYQTASDVETIVDGKGYQTATQVNTAIEGKGYQTSSDVQKAINDALADVTGIDIQVVTTLPTIGTKGVIYLVAHSHGDNDSYDEYVWLSSAEKYEKIGSTDIDLSAYTKDTDFTDVGASEIDTLWDAVTV